ncbi:unnamed protein product, partial [Allacma fusca]
TIGGQQLVSLQQPDGHPNSNQIEPPNPAIQGPRGGNQPEHHQERELRYNPWVPTNVPVSTYTSQNPNPEDYLLAQHH